MDHFRPRSGYQPCDTFFVEEDLRAQAEKQAKQEHDKLVNRERQYALATQLSRLTSDEYRDDAVQHMMEMDSRTLPDVESIDIQSEIQWFMRPYLLDFLIEAHSAFQLLPSSLFLAINLLDRYCSKRVVYKRHYQLVGCAALLIAAKYNDKKDRVPNVKELKSMCCSLYDDDMFIQMEWHVLQTLGWSVGHPTVDEFLSIALLDEPYDAEVEHMALYILEIALFHRDFVSKLSSELARAALALARCVLNRPQPRHNDWAAQYDSSTVVDLSLHIHQPSNVVARKYASSHFSRVAKIMEQFLSRQASLASYSRCTPPVESAVDSKPYMGEMGLATPQKPQQLSAVSRGYMTPPITPDTGAYSSQATGQELGHGATAPHGCLPSEVDTEMQYMATDAYHPQEAVYLPQQSHQVASYAPQGQMVIEQTYSAIM